MTDCRGGFDCDRLSQLARRLGEGHILSSVSQGGQTGREIDLKR